MHTYPPITAEYSAALSLVEGAIRVVLDIPQGHEIADKVRRSRRRISSDVLGTAAGPPAVPLGKKRVEKGDGIRMTHHVRKVGREAVLGTSLGSAGSFVTKIKSGPRLPASYGAKTVLIVVDICRWRTERIVVLVVQAFAVSSGGNSVGDCPLGNDMFVIG